MQKKVMVTGGSGFLGRHIVSSLKSRDFEVSVPRSKNYDLTDLDSARSAITDLEPEIIVHAAADVGGIGYNQLFPADIFTNNLRMACNIMQAAAEAQIEKLVNVGSACAYPGEVDGLMHEDSFLTGAMHPSVEVYGLSKRALYLGAEAFRQQFGLESIFLVITNLFGPHDKYNPKDSHVVAAMIRRFVEAVDDELTEVTCWGTGSPTREFMYAEDCAEAIAEATVKYSGAAPLNIGTGKGTSIKELAELSAKAAGYAGTIDWDTSKPDGAMYKVLDISRMEKELDGFKAQTSIEEGLKTTIEWFREERPS
jgi:GDP-L-fucose synthase